MGGADQQLLSVIPPQSGGTDHSGQWDASTWNQQDQSAGPADQTQQWEWGTQAFDTGAYDATQWNSEGTTADPQATAAFEQVGYGENHTYDETHAYGEANPHGDAYAEHAPHDGESTATGEMPAVHDADAPLLDEQEEAGPAPIPAQGSRVAARTANRSRRRMPAKRSALLTIAVPSACVMGVAGIAAASVGTLTSDGQETSTTLADTTGVKPAVANNKLDSQLESLSAGADDFADRASRTQERIDLKAQQVAEKKKAAEEAARKERLRPKFALPVAQRVSAPTSARPASTGCPSTPESTSRCRTARR